MGSSERPDFSGVWRQVKNENFDGFLKVRRQSAFYCFHLGLGSGQR